MSRIIQRVVEYDGVDMAQRGRIGGLVTSSRHDPRATTANARQAFLNSFEKRVDPDGTLPEPERKRRAEAARRAHFARLALKSAQVRRARKAGVQ